MHSILWVGFLSNLLVASACLLVLLHLRKMRRRGKKIAGAVIREAAATTTTVHVPEIVLCRDLDTQNMILASANVSTTKGTGGDVIILEEAAYCDPGFFYETVAPLLLIGRTSLLAISTLTSEINFYSRLIKMKDPMTQEPIFKTFSVELACSKCKDDGKATECKHMLHLVPSWQSSDKHMRLKTVMQDRPDLIASELSGLAFDALQQCFRKVDVENMIYKLSPAAPQLNESICIFVDPAAGGPSSDYAIMSIVRSRGIMTVRITTL